MRGPRGQERRRESGGEKGDRGRGGAGNPGLVQVWTRGSLEGAGSKGARNSAVASRGRSSRLRQAFCLASCWPPATLCVCAALTGQKGGLRGRETLQVVVDVGANPSPLVVRWHRNQPVRRTVLHSKRTTTACTRAPQSVDRGQGCQKIQGAATRERAAARQRAICQVSGQPISGPHSKTLQNCGHGLLFKSTCPGGAGRVCPGRAGLTCRSCDRGAARPAPSLPGACACRRTSCALMRFRPLPARAGVLENAFSGYSRHACTVPCSWVYPRVGESARRAPACIGHAPEHDAAASAASRPSRAHHLH